MHTEVSEAIIAAEEIRIQSNLSVDEPINIFDFCTENGITVRFVDIDMEGFYCESKAGLFSTILLSNKRPFARRCFTCAHEYGHHVFKHGSKYDPISENKMKNFPVNAKHELIADLFAGYFLMPITGILSEFSKRGWNIETASSLQFFIISSIFGTGYDSLIHQCYSNQLIDNKVRSKLLKSSPSKILKLLLGNSIPLSYFRIIDEQTIFNSVDIEVSNYIFLPANYAVNSNNLIKIRNSDFGTAYKALKSGIIPIDNTQSLKQIRIQKENYIGFAEYRFLET